MFKDILMRFCYVSLFFLLSQGDNKVHIHWKGAAEMVLGSCTEYLDSNGCLQPMGEDKVQVNALSYVKKTFLWGQQNLILCHL